MLRSLFGTRKSKAQATAIYAAIVAASRQREFYSDLGVSDSLEGRFEVLVLHAWLTMSRLGAGSKAAQEASQEAFDLMFAELDRSLRESGVGDLSVPKQVRHMAEAFYGRSKAYGLAVAEDAPREALATALGRNIFGGEALQTQTENVNAMASYTRAAVRVLSQAGENLLIKGDVPFPDAGSFVPCPEDSKLAGILSDGEAGQ